MNPNYIKLQWVAQAISTYGGRNTATQIANDSVVLRAAAQRDLDAYRSILESQGYSQQKIDEAFRKLHEANVKAGLYQ